MSRFYFYVFLMTLFVSCDKVEYSPNQINDKSTPREINRKNIETLLSDQTQGNTIEIAFIGDSQRYYDDAVAFKNKVNELEGIDFVFLAGDISDFGLKQEFEWVHEIFSGLDIPYIGIIGNHDHGGNGEKTYRYMFGDLDFSFVYKGVKFVCHNTNSREYNFNGQVPDINWLKQQLTPREDISYFITISHVPPFDEDFDKNLEASYTELFRNTPGLIASLHGHKHNTNDGYFYADSVRYINSNAVDKREFLLLEITDGKILKTLIPY